MDAAGASSGRLSIEQLTKAYDGRPVLDSVTFDVEPGEVCGLLGPNGAGKTTLVSIISGLRTADSGRVTIGSVDVATGGRQTRGMVGLAGQETGVYPTIPVRDNLDLFAGLAGLRGRDKARRVEEVAEIFELGDLMDRPGRSLSGGEKRRLHTAMALLHRPRVLLLDEPTTGVDVGSRSRLLAAVRRLASDEGCSVLYSTHYLREIEELDASVVFLDRGAVVARGSVRELVAEHGQGAVTIEFDGPAPAIAGATVEGNRLVRRTDLGGTALADMIVGIGEDAARVVGVDLTEPDLESVFRALTGRTYAPAGFDEGAHG